MLRSVSRRTLTLLAAAAMVVAALLLLGPGPAAAYGSYTNATGQPCSACHVDPAGGGARNNLGQAFEAISSHRTDPAGAWAQVSASGPFDTPTPTATDSPTVTTATQQSEDESQEQDELENDDDSQELDEDENGGEDADEDDGDSFTELDAVSATEVEEHSARASDDEVEGREHHEKAGHRERSHNWAEFWERHDDDD